MVERLGRLSDLEVWRDIRASKIEGAHVRANPPQTACGWRADYYVGDTPLQHMLGRLNHADNPSRGWGIVTKNVFTRPNGQKGKRL